MKIEKYYQYYVCKTSRKYLDSINSVTAIDWIFHHL